MAFVWGIDCTNISTSVFIIIHTSTFQKLNTLCTDYCIPGWIEFHRQLKVWGNCSCSGSLNNGINRIKLLQCKLYATSLVHPCVFDSLHVFFKPHKYFNSYHFHTTESKVTIYTYQSYATLYARRKIEPKMFAHTGLPARLVEEPILMTECPLGTKCAVQDDCASVVGEEASELIVGCIFYL